MFLTYSIAPLVLAEGTAPASTEGRPMTGQPPMTGGLR
jgi:hypothetical protein